MSKTTDQYAEIFEMLLLARTHIKYPSIRFVSTSGTKVSFTLACKGYIAIKLDSIYQGKIIDKDTPMVFYPKNAEELKKEIEVFASFPKYNTKIHGQQFGTCCFCGRELTEKASIFYGYGPICADNFGLPHELSENDIKKSKEDTEFAALDDPDF